MRFPWLVVAQQRDRFAGEAEPVGAQALSEDLGGLANRVPVILEVEVELPVGVAEGAGVDGAAKLLLAKNRPSCRRMKGSGKSTRSTGASGGASGVAALAVLIELVAAESSTARAKLG
jgi:hypothetical protein